MTKAMLVSRCAWTLYNFRQGQMQAMRDDGMTVLGGGSDGDGFEGKIEALGVPFMPLPIHKRAINPKADMRLILSLYRWYKAERPQIVHHFTIKPVIYGSIAARLAGVPRIVNTITGLGYVFMEGGAVWLRNLVELQYKVALRASHFTFFQNPDDLNLFIGRGLVNKSKTGLLPGSGVDTNRFAPQAQPISGGPDRPVRFIMVARLLRDKGLYEFAEAAKKLKSEGANAEFVLLGGRDERNPHAAPLCDVEAWINEGTLKWLGESSDVRGPLSEADVAVLPSYREGTPRSLLEAAAMGKPIITADSVGCRETVDHGVNGLLVPVRDADALAEAMRTLLNAPELRKRMGCAGREKALREFDEKIVIRSIMDVYHRERL